MSSTSQLTFTIIRFSSRVTHSSFINVYGVLCTASVWLISFRSHFLTSHWMCKKLTTPVLLFSQNISVFYFAFWWLSKCWWDLPGAGDSGAIRDEVRHALRVDKTKILVQVDYGILVPGQITTVKPHCYLHKYLATVTSDITKSVITSHLSAFINFLYFSGITLCLYL